VQTIGIDFAIKKLSGPDGETITLQIWDTAGADRFKTIANNYYRGINAAAIVFDLTDSFGLEGAERSLVEYERNCNEDAIKILVGTKADLEEKRSISTQVAEEFAAENGNISYVELNSKDGKNVDKFVQMVLEKLIHQEKTRREKADTRKKNSQKSKLCNIL